MNKLGLIIKREFLAKVRNKSFIIMTFLSPLLMIGMFALITYVSKSSLEKTRVLSYVNESTLFSKKDFKDTQNVKYVDLTPMGLMQAKKSVEASEGFGLLYIPNISNIDSLSNGMQFFSSESPGVGFLESLEGQYRDKFKNLKMKEMGLDTLKLKAMEINTNIHTNSFEGKATSKTENTIQLILGSISGYLIMMFIIVYGAMVMRSVIEEKTSRIIEVIVSSVKPFYLMLGKVIGTAGAGIAQFLIWIVVIFILGAVLSPILGVSHHVAPEQMELAQKMGEISETQLFFNELYQLPLGTIAIAFILFFTGGYLLYSSLYAAIGAAVDNETDTQQFMMPIMMPLMLGIYIGFSVVINDPNGTLATVFSLIPFTSPIVMMMRIPMGVPIWQIALSLLLLYTTFLGMIWLTAKIYRVGILMYGKKPTYRELWKWLKY
jgi:ABC-2 type transport system permease protein